MTFNATAGGSRDPLSLHGVIPPTLTAFDADESVNVDATVEHAKFVVERGCHGVFVLGTNGEFPLLDHDERCEIVAAVAGEISSVPVLAGVGAPSTRKTIDLARDAERNGADGLVVVTPYYYPLDERAAVTHYRRVAASVDLPIYLYHIPARTGNTLSIATLSKLAEIDAVAGLKDSSKDLNWMERAIEATPELTCLAGSDSLILESLDLGCTGVVSGVSNVFPGVVVDLYEAVHEGDVDRTEQLHETVSEARSAFKAGPYLSGVKTALSLRSVDFDVGGLRNPLRLMDDDERATLEGKLRKLDLL